jgi:tetratricopeptide (TPR) repeat protein
MNFLSCGRDPGFSEEQNKASGDIDMRIVFFMILLAVRICHASEPSKGWNDWFSEGKAVFNSGNYSAAARAFREAVGIAEHSDVTDRQLVELHGALAGAYAEAGQFAESEGEYRCALALVEKAEGRRSLKYAFLLARMAILPTQTGNRDEVIALLREAIAAHVRVGYTENITVIRECLAQILRKEKRYQEEEPLLLDALADLTKQKEANPALMSAALNNLAVLRFDQERYEESINLQEQSIRVLEMASGKEHPSLVAPLNDLATAYIRVGRFDDADVTYRRAIDICRRTLGEDHVAYGVLLRNYAFVLRKLGHRREAKKMETQGQMIQRAVNRRNGVGATISVTALRSDSP